MYVSHTSKAMLHGSLFITRDLVDATAILISLAEISSSRKFRAHSTYVFTYLFTEQCFVPYMNPWPTYHEGSVQHSLRPFALPCRTDRGINWYTFACCSAWTRNFVPSSQRGGTQKGTFFNIYIWVSVQRKSIIYNKPTRCNSGSIVFINYRYALHVSDALCVHRQEQYKL